MTHSAEITHKASAGRDLVALAEKAPLEDHPGDVFERAILSLQCAGFTAKRMFVRLAAEYDAATLAVRIELGDERIAWTGPANDRRPAGFHYRRCHGDAPGFLLFSGYGSEAIDLFVMALVDWQSRRARGLEPHLDLGEWDPHTLNPREAKAIEAQTTAKALRRLLKD